MSYKVEVCKELAQSIKAQGFRVFLSSSETYGFFTNKEGTRVVSFQFDLGGVSFAGNYKSSQPRKCGTGWAMEAGLGFRRMIEAYPPHWATGGHSYEFTTLEQHLKNYAASGYTEI